MIAKTAQRCCIVALGIALARSEAHAPLFRVPSDEINLHGSGLCLWPVPVAGNAIGNRKVRSAGAGRRLGGFPDHAFECMSLKCAERGERPLRHPRRGQYARGLTSRLHDAQPCAQELIGNRVPRAALSLTCEDREFPLDQPQVVGHGVQVGSQREFRQRILQFPRAYSLGVRPASSGWQGNCAAAHARAALLPPRARGLRSAETAARIPVAPTVPTPGRCPGRRFRRSGANTWARRRTASTASDNAPDRRRHGRGTPRRWW